MSGHKLTILLTLKGRYKFTYRWLEYAKKRSFPFKILIADGGSDDTVLKYIEKGDFEDLNIRYVKFGEDLDFETYYNKVRKSLELIDTPYYIIADNDDLYSPDSLIEAVNFLEDNEDYVACGGKLVSFSINNGNIYGDRIKFYRSNFDYYSESKASERVIKYLCGAPGPYYSVIKTEIVRDAWKIICQRNFKDIRMFELFLDMFILSTGKVFNLPNPFFFKQIGRRVGSEFSPSHDVLDEMFSPTWSEEINYLADLIVERCKDENFTHKEFWLYFKSFILPRLLNGISLDSKNKNSSKIRRIMLVKSLRSGRIFSLLIELLFLRRGNGFDKNNLDIKYVNRFLTKLVD